MCAMIRGMDEAPNTKPKDLALTPCPPVPLTAYELISIMRTAATNARRAARRSQANFESGRLDSYDGQHDADALRAENLTRIYEKLDEWIVATWPSVWAAMCDAGDCEDEDASREAWLAEVYPEGSRLQRLHPPKATDDSFEGLGETLGEARFNARRALERRVGSVKPDKIKFVTVTEGQRGMLGVGHEPARVLARLTESE